MSAKFLVTGAAGFLGSHLTKKLIERNHSVVGVDNLYTGNIQNLRDVLGSPLFTFIEQDVETPLNIEVDGIFNLACPASPVHYQYNPVKTVRTNVLGAINMLELATKLEVPIFQASTSEVYGDPEISPQPESYWGKVNPIGIRSCYDEGKRVAETLFFDYHRQYGTKIRVARIFNTYGPNMAINDGRVVSNFIVQALSGDDLSVYGTGSQTRSFCYVDDLIESILKFYFLDNPLPGPINLGNPQAFTMIELAQKVIELTKSSSKITFEPLPSDDPKQRMPDISLAKTELSWNPTIGLEEGLRKTILYFSSKMEL